MTKRTIMIPITDNDGQSLLTEISRIEDELVALAAGFTVNASAGAWRSDDGLVYRDQNLTNIVVCDAKTDAKLIERLPEWADWLRQQALLTDAASVELVLVLAPNGTDRETRHAQSERNRVNDHICHSFSTYDLLTELLTGQDNGVQHGTPEA